MRRAILLSALFSFLTAAAFAENVVDSTYTAVDVYGDVQACAPHAGCKPLKRGMELPLGTKVATGEKSWADFAADVYYENMLRVSADSNVTFLNAVPMRVALDRGSLFVLNEPHFAAGNDQEAVPEIRILTRDFLAALRQGGCKLESSASGAVLFAFAEAVRIYPKTPGGGYAEVPFEVEEGFRYSREGWKRMEYPDYMDWQIWFKKNNERKDDLPRR